MLRIRHHADGTLWIPRQDAQTEAYLDARHERYRAGELRWVPRPEDPQDWTDQLAGMHAGRRAIVFGKGPSLDSFRSDPAGELRVALNETALVIPDPDFVFFVDPRVGGAVSGRLPLTCIPVRPISAVQYPVLLPGQWSMTWRWTQDQERAGVPSAYATAPAALHTLGLWGVEEILAVGFDGYDGDHAADGEGVYAGCLEDVLVVDRENAAYLLINRQIDECIRFWGLRVTWAHRADPA